MILDWNELREQRETLRANKRGYARAFVFDGTHFDAIDDVFIAAEKFLDLCTSESLIPLPQSLALKEAFKNIGLG